MQFQLDFLKTRSLPLIGIDISSSAVKMVELSDSGKGRKRLERYAIEQLPKDSVVDGNIANLEAVSDCVKRTWKRMGTSIKSVALALPTAAVISKKITLPAGQRDEDMEFQVETEANQYIPFALEEVYLDFQVIGPSPAGPEEVEVLLAASRKEKVEDRVAVAESAGLKTLVMDVESYAAQTALELIETQLPAGGKDQNIAIVDIGASMMNVTVMRNDQSIYMREQAAGGIQLTAEIQRHYNLSLEEAEAAKRSGGLPDTYETEVLAPFTETLALEVARALQFFFTSTQFNSVEHVLLAGGCAMIPGLQQSVTARTQVDTLIANPFQSMDRASRIRDKQLENDAPSLMIACGLAMRRFD